MTSEQSRLGGRLPGPREVLQNAGYWIDEPLLDCNGVIFTAVRDDIAIPFTVHNPEHLH